VGQIHHLDVGCADASVIQTPTATFLVDCHNIGNYAHLLPASKRLRGVFITHQHWDHYSGLEYLRNNGYSIEHLIYSPYVRRWGDNSVTAEEWNDFNNHLDYFVKRGTYACKPFRQDNFNDAWWKPDGLSFWVLGPAPIIAESETRELHDACLVFTVRAGIRRCCYTGDASDSNLLYIADNTNKYCGDILRASHHASINGAELKFIKGAEAQYTVISTASGVHENVPHLSALQRYRDNTVERVYRTDQDGSVSWYFAP